MDSLISQLFQEGQAAESGHFSLDPRARVEKLQRFQNEEPALYLLKGVQAAVASGAESVSVRLSRTYVEVRFRPKQSIRLQDALAGNTHLAAMLLAALSTRPKEVTIELDQQIWSSTSSPTRRAAPGEFRLHLSRQGSGFWQRFLPARQSADVQQTLAQRCALCPIPVYLDGRTINQGIPENLSAVANDLTLGTRGAGNPIWAVELLELARDTQNFCLAGFERRPTGHLELNRQRYPGSGLFDGYRNSRVVLLECPEVEVCASQRPDLPSIGAVNGQRYALTGGGSGFGELRLHRWLGLREVPNSTFTLIYIKHGVALNAVSTRGIWPGAYCVLCADELETDLSQLEMIRGQQTEAFRKILSDVSGLQTQFGITQHPGTPFAKIDQDIRTYRPEAERLWDRDYTLPSDFASGMFPLGSACDLFPILRNFAEPVTLWINQQERVLVILYGPQSEVSDHKLADLGRMTWVELFQQQRPPRTRLLLRAGERWLQFSSDDQHQPQLEEYARNLAQKARCGFKFHPTQETSPDAP
ncbi:MAG: hypothetical protein U0931_34755 [Vulcanimicrobiota bacterium]